MPAMIVRIETGEVYDLNASLLRVEPDFDRKLFGINFLESIL